MDVEWLATDRKQLCRVSDGESIAVWDRGGTGTPIVFEHGFPQNHRRWAEVVAHLDLPEKPARLIAYDLRGHGESSKQGEASWQRLFQDHLDIVASLGIERYHLVGHDWGGAIALHVSRYHPEQLRSLVVLNTNYWKTDVGGMWHMLLLNAPIVAPMLFRIAPNLVYEIFMIRSLIDHGRLDPAVAESYRSSYRDLPTTTYWIRLYRNMAKGLIRQALPASVQSRIRTSAIVLPRTSDAAFQIPTRLIWGRLDTFNPLPIGEDMARRLTKLRVPVELVVVDGAKHFVPEDQPAQVGHLISEHVLRHWDAFAPTVSIDE